MPLTKRMGYKTSLLDGAKEMAIELNEAQASKLLEYLMLMNKWNKTYNLSAIRTVQEGIKKHLLDSLSIIPFVENAPLLDVGSGAGLPGIVIAIMRPNVPVSVLDTIGKKCCFMQFVKSQLRLTNLSVVNHRVETFKSEQCFAQITSRAFAETNKTLKITQHLLCDNGRYLLMKGANVEQEVLPKDVKIHQLSVSGISNERFLLELRKRV